MTTKKITARKRVNLAMRMRGRSAYNYNNHAQYLDSLRWFRDAETYRRYINNR